MLALHNMMIFEDGFFMGFFFYSIDRLFLVIILKVSEYENMLVGTCTCMHLVHFTPIECYFSLLVLVHNVCLSRWD